MKILLPLIILLFSFSAFAQEKKVIRWLSPDLPKECCTNYMREGELRTGFHSADLDYLVTLKPNLLKGYFIVSIVFQNHSEKAFTVDPAKFKIRMTEPINREYSAESAADVAKKVGNDGKWRGIFAAAMAGMATKNSTATVRDNRGNQADIIVTEKDDAPLRNVQEKNRQRQNKNNNTVNAVENAALAANTVFKDEMYGGFVYFKREKIADGLILSFDLDGTTYEIPYGTERTKLDKPVKP